MDKHHLIIGGAGFIGSKLSLELSKIGKVSIIDNLSNGNTDFIKDLFIINDFKFIQTDVSDFNNCDIAFNQINLSKTITDVWHLAANSDIPAGINDPGIDLKNTFLTTFQILCCMKKYNIKNIHFASSSAIYGDCNNIEISEDHGPLKPISNYGAMKLASEAQISASFESFLNKVNIFRFPNVVGSPATHGVIFDFINKLKINKSVLNVLGDGSQRKPYLHVSDLVNALIYFSDLKSVSNFEIYNIGPNDDGIDVKTIAELVVDTVNKDAKIIFGSGNKGWIGDVSKFRYSIKKINSLGWKPKYNSFEAISKAICEINNQIK